MPEASTASPCFRIAGPAGERAARVVRERLDDRVARGVLTVEEIERVSSARLLRFDVGGGASEAFRRCCVAWEVGRLPPITSHRPVVGRGIVAVKQLVARLLRFQNESFLARQSEFNRNLLLVLRELLERSERRERG